jgi:hypothetical protein
MVKVGGEIDTFCTRCDLVLAHTVHAVVAGRPVRVECNTCHATHRFKDAGGASRAPARPQAGRADRPRHVTGFEELLAARTRAPRRYSPRDSYAPDDVLDHPTFGRGFVSAVRDGGKIEVTFRSDVRVLVHARG